MFTKITKKFAYENNIDAGKLRLIIASCTIQYDHPVDSSATFKSPSRPFSLRKSSCTWFGWSLSSSATLKTMRCSRQFN